MAKVNAQVIESILSHDDKPIITNLHKVTKKLKEAGFVLNGDTGKWQNVDGLEIYVDVDVEEGTLIVKH